MTTASYAKERERLATAASETIAATMTLLDRPARWIRGIGAADKDGRECAPGHKAATCFCLYQAMLHASGHTGDENERMRTPGLRDVHEAIQRHLRKRDRTVGYHRQNPNPGALVVAWNDDMRTSHDDVLEVLSDAAAAIDVRGRALRWDEGPEAPMRSTGVPKLDAAMWGVVRTLSTENEGNSELIDAGEELLRCWHEWQDGFR